jgi:hypothetical protein
MFPPPLLILPLLFDIELILVELSIVAMMMQKGNNTVKDVMRDIMRNVVTNIDVTTL